MKKQHKNCPITYAMKVIGGKWKPIIFMRLSQGINRFGILSRSIEGISKNMLTRELRDLEAQKIICLLYTSPSPRDPKTSRMPSSA